MLDYDTWIEAIVRLNDTYIGSKPYNVSRFLQMKVHKMHNIDQVRGGGLMGGGADSVTDCRRTRA